MDFSQSSCTNTSSSSSPSPSPILPVQALASSSSSQNVEKEHLFDKIVTPSDVGKLNRLVIPKQHAERCFPLDTSTTEKGLLLNFEDRIGKQWRFRYSYWNSSQSYVMTKGWSRFVKEKHLNAGDTVSFGRGIENKDRLFIDWRRRPEVIRSNSLGRHLSYPMLSFGRSVVPRSNYLYNVGGGGGEQFLVFRTPMVGPRPVSRVDGTVERPIVLDSVPVMVPSNNVGRRVRLFGVDFDLPRVEAESSSSSALTLTWPVEEEKEKEKENEKEKEKEKVKDKDEPSLDLQM